MRRVHYGGGLHWLMVVLLVLTVPANLPAADDTLIIPGVRVGQLTLAMTVDDLVRINGRAIPILIMAGLPPAADAVYDHTVLTWDRVAALTFDRRGRVEVLLVGRPASYIGRSYKTGRGISMDSTRAAVLRAYGPPTAENVPERYQTRLIYDPLGIAFQVDASGRMVGIAIFRPGMADRYWHLL